MARHKSPGQTSTAATALPPRQFRMEKIRAMCAVRSLNHLVAEWRHPGNSPEVLFQHMPQALNNDQIAQLQSQGNYSDDWSSIRIAPGANLAAIRRCDFQGDCFIGIVGAPNTRPGEADSPGGRLDLSRFSDAIIGDHCTILDAGMIQKAILGPMCTVVRVGVLAGRSMHCFGLNREIVFSPGSGGRQLPVVPDMPPSALAELACRMGDKDLVSRYRKLCDEFAGRNATEFTILCDHVQVSNVPRLTNSYIGPMAKIDGALCIDDCVLLSSPESRVSVGVGVTLRQVTAQEGSNFVDGAFCENCHFAEGSWAKDSARVTSCIIAENSGVGGGECRTSFLGPFVAFHHQSLLIATFWPGGRGNVSYGANVGSNHSGKAPDQEHWAGEGVFYGLGCCVKFPANFSEAPYSLIASGVTTLPQRFSFPFSLINTPGLSIPALSPAINEVFPGWMIQNNMYGLLRNEAKFAERNTARREMLETRAFRADIVPQLQAAIRTLEGRAAPAGTRGGQSFWTDKEIPGLGKNFVTERAVDDALKAYEFGVKFIVARAIKVSMEAQERTGVMLEREFSELQNLLDLLKMAASRETLIAWCRPILEEAYGMAEKCRQNDDERGARIIPDYAEVHGRADKDSFLRRLRRQLLVWE